MSSDSITLKELFQQGGKKLFVLMLLGLIYSVATPAICLGQRLIFQNLSQGSQKIAASVGVFFCFLGCYRFLEFSLRIVGSQSAAETITHLYLRLKRRILHEAASAMPDASYHIKIISHFFNEIVVSVWLVVVPLGLYPLMIAKRYSQGTGAVVTMVGLFLAISVLLAARLQGVLAAYKQTDHRRLKALDTYLTHLPQLRLQHLEDLLLSRIVLESKNEQDAKIRLLKVISQINAISFFSPYFCIAALAVSALGTNSDNLELIEMASISLFLLVTPMKGFPWLLIVYFDMKTSLAQINQLFSDSMAYPTEDASRQSYQRLEFILKDLLHPFNARRRHLLVHSRQLSYQQLVRHILHILSSLDGKRLTPLVLGPEGIFSGTLEANISVTVEATEVDRRRIQQALQVSQLDHDLQLGLLDSPSQEIEHRGSNLSGGQRDRLLLARAIYLQADVYILSDLFSSSDEATRTRLLESFLKVLENKPVLIISENQSYRPFVSEVATLA